MEYAIRSGVIVNLNSNMPRIKEYILWYIPFFVLLFCIVSDSLQPKSDMEREDDCMQTTSVKGAVA